jgi:ribosome-associated translation inhibitor RaiA
MKIRIHSPRLKLPKALPLHAERRLGLALARFGDRVDRVVLRFSMAAADAVVPERNGRRPAGKNRLDRAEKRCEIVVSLHSRKVRIEDTDVDFVAAFNGAVRRASRSVARAIERENWWELASVNHVAVRSGNARSRPARAQPIPHR